MLLLEILQYNHYFVTIPNGRYLPSNHTIEGIKLLDSYYRGKVILLPVYGITIYVESHEIYVSTDLYLKIPSKNSSWPGDILLIIGLPNIDYMIVHLYQLTIGHETSSRSVALRNNIFYHNILY